MCDVDDNIESVRLVRCAHGHFHLHLGKLTLHLTNREMQLLVRTTAAWVETEHEHQPPHHPATGGRPRLPWNDQ